MRLATLATVLACASALPALAQVVVTTGQPVVGSSNPITPEPPVVRPTTTPCVVPLFTNMEFADYSAKTYAYTPPSGCPGPWAKVVFTADFTVTAGIQYDRTAELFLGHTNLYFGTTAEPSPGFSPSWHVEKDVTDLSTLFQTQQSGEADIFNIVNSTYTGIIYANAALEFYPVDSTNAAVKTPDIVVPLPDAAGSGAFVNNSSQALTQTVTLPRNVESMYLDIYAQSQSNDEFWWSCVPNDDVAVLDTCGGTGFRETEITIDGAPAGVAPVYPWIYTGGADTNLWMPIPGVQTLDFKPYRVDLTPFAGNMDDGQPHTIAVSVHNAQSGFRLVGTLLAYQDKASNIVTGGVNIDTLSPTPVEHTDNQITGSSPADADGFVSTASQRNYVIGGSVNTSHGMVRTVVHNQKDFSTRQDVTPYLDQVTQRTDVETIISTFRGNNVIPETTLERHSYPFTFIQNETVNADGSFSVMITSNQTDRGSHQDYSFGFDPNPYEVGTENVTSQDTLLFDAQGYVTGSTGTSSTASEILHTATRNYSESLASDNNVLTSFNHCTNGQCEAGSSEPFGSSGGVRKAVRPSAVTPLIKLKKQ